MVRAFIGIPVSDEVRAALAGLQRELGRCSARVKWTEPENIHLTLRFLGEMDDQMAERVKTAMDEAAGGGPIPFRVDGVGSFPPRGKPRVIWAGVSDGAGAVSELQTKLEAALDPLGFEKERRFVPHLTIGRVKAPQGAEELIPRIERHAGTQFGSCTASEMVLFESRLTPGGAVYTALARQTL